MRSTSLALLAIAGLLATARANEPDADRADNTATQETTVVPR